MVERPGRVTVIGLGNPLMGDDGLGLCARERLMSSWSLSPDVEIVDGGTWGMNLLPIIEDASSLLFIDAVDNGLPAGTPIVLSGDEIPRALAHKISPHQVDLSEVLAVAQLRGTLPKRMTLIGLQPERVELGEGLSAPVEAGLDGLVAMAAHHLRLWGHSCEPREVTASA